MSQRVLGYDPTYGRFAFLGPAHGYDHTYGVFAFLRSVTSKRLFRLLWVTLSWTLRWLELLNLSCLSMCLACHIILIGTGTVLARLREKAAIPSQRYMAGTGPCSWSEPTMGLNCYLTLHDVTPKGRAFWILFWILMVLASHPDRSIHSCLLPSSI